MDIVSPEQTPHTKNFKITIIVLASILFVAVGVYIFLTYSSTFTPQNTQNREISAVQSDNSGVTKATESDQSQKNDKILNSNESLDLYYLDEQHEKSPTGYSISKVAQNFEIPDIQTHSFTNTDDSYSRVITNSWKNDSVLFISQNDTLGSVSVIDLTTPSSSPQMLLTIPLNSGKKEMLGDVRFVDGGSNLALITYEEGFSNAKNSVLHIFSLETKQEKEMYALNPESPKYAGFGFLNKTADNSIIYLHETGGDGGYVWSQWYRVNRKENIFTKMEGLPHYEQSIEGEYPTESEFSPSGTQLAYVSVSKKYNPSDIDTVEDGFLSGCLKLLGKYDTEGGVIMVQDLKTSNKKEVFRNLSYPSNYCQNVGRRIVDLVWLDENHLAFETIDGVYNLDLITRSSETLFTFEKSVNSPGEQQRPSLLAVKLPYIIFTDGTVANITSKKILDSGEHEFFVTD